MPYQFNCLYCQAPYTRPAKTQTGGKSWRYCSRACVNAARQNFCSCANCSQPVARSKSLVKGSVYCGRPCRNDALARRSEAKLRATFWSRFDQAGPVPISCPDLGPCWVWREKANGAGYGAVNGRFVAFGWVKGAHRIAYVLANGSLPAKGQVLHRCDIKLCGNPAHLFDGTQQENMADMIAKGRAASVDAKRHLGSAHGLAKLTEADIPRIREIGQDRRKQLALALEYGVSRGLVSQIVLKRVWRHVP